MYRNREESSLWFRFNLERAIVAVDRCWFRLSLTSFQLRCWISLFCLVARTTHYTICVRLLEKFIHQIRTSEAQQGKSIFFAVTSICMAIVAVAVVCFMWTLFNDTTRYGSSLRTDWSMRQETQFKAISKTQRTAQETHTRTTNECQVDTQNTHIQLSESCNS